MQQSGQFGRNGIQWRLQLRPLQMTAPRNASTVEMVQLTGYRRIIPAGTNISDAAGPASGCIGLIGRMADGLSASRLRTARPVLR